MLNLTQVYEELLAGKRVTISTPSQQVTSLIYSQLRTLKSRYDKKYKELTGDSISEGKVVRYEESESPPNGFKVVFYLGETKRKSKIEYKIIDIE